MTILFGNLGDGRTMRTFGTVAAVSGLGAIAFGGVAERYARAHRAAPSLTSLEISGLSQLRAGVVDYLTTGSLDPKSRRELAVVRACRDILAEY
jgi:hypothetical protein